jgi:hypothetical protein
VVTHCAGIAVVAGSSVSNRLKLTSFCRITRAERARGGRGTAQRFTRLTGELDALLGAIARIPIGAVSVHRALGQHPDTLPVIARIDGCEGTAVIAGRAVRSRHRLTTQNRITARFHTRRRGRTRRRGGRLAYEVLAQLETVANVAVIAVRIGGAFGDHPLADSPVARVVHGRGVAVVTDGTVGDRVMGAGAREARVGRACITVVTGARVTAQGAYYDLVREGRDVPGVVIGRHDEVVVEACIETLDQVRGTPVGVRGDIPQIDPVGVGHGVKREEELVARDVRLGRADPPQQVIPLRSLGPEGLHLDEKKNQATGEGRHPPTAQHRNSGVRQLCHP